METEQPGKYILSYSIPEARTFNTLPPFSSSITKGAECTVYAVRIVGKAPQPCIYVGGGTHGDEINGVAATLRIIDELSPNSLVGSMVLVPVQNPLGYKYRARLNPYDPIDPDWVHPGRPSGAYTQNLKKVLCQLVEGADCVIDLHTAGRGGVNNTMIYVPPETGDGWGDKSLQLSIAFGGDQIIQGEKLTDYGWPVDYALPFLGVRNGKTGMYAESGEGGSTIPDSKSVDYFVTGVYNVMKALGIIDGDIVEQGMRQIIDPRDKRTHSVTSPKEGVFFPSVEPGNHVKKGQVLGKVYGIPFGVFEVSSQIDGYITWRSSFGAVGENENLFTISK